jgi:hypothetical protein
METTYDEIGVEDQGGEGGEEAEVLTGVGRNCEAILVRFDLSCGN